MLKEKFLQSIKRELLLTPGMRLVVAVSGGADSVCLLHLLASVRDEFPLELIVAHLNHGFRGTESEGDAAYVAQLAHLFQLPAVIETQDIPALRLRRHLSAQQAAREARHAFLRRVLTEHKANRIALGHTRDDRVETILGNLLRGTGLEGLAAMPPMELPLIRPLCDITRAETYAYCEQHQLYPRVDSSNADLHYRRNRMRAELLPFLRTYFNRDADTAILRMAALASADNYLLEQLASDALCQCLEHATSDARTLNRKLCELPLALQRRVLRQSIAQIRGSLYDVGFASAEQALQAFGEGQTFGVNLPAREGVTTRLICTSDVMIIERLAAPSQARGWEIPLQVPGETDLPPAQMKIQALILPFGEREKPTSGLRFPLSAVTLPLVARSRRTGDRVAWGEPNGTSKVQDILTDAKIPAERRDAIPIIADASGKILSVFGLKKNRAALSIHAVLPPDEPILELRWVRFAEQGGEADIFGTFP